jgi:hypothetical protein
VPGEEIETSSDSERVENHEPDQDRLTPEQEQQEDPDEKTHEMDTLSFQEFDDVSFLVA